MHRILLKNKNKILCKAESIHVEQHADDPDFSTVRLINHDNSDWEMNIYNESKLIIDILFNTQKYGMVVGLKATLYPDSIQDKDDYIEITGETYFSNRYDEYDQNLIDYLYKYGDTNEIVDRSGFSDKDFCSFLETLAMYRNFPKHLERKPEYIFDGGDVRNKCDLFIQLGEMFAGKQTYFCYGLDVLGKSLRYHFKDMDSKIPFEIRNKDVIIQKVGAEYFERMLNVLDPFFILELR